MNYSTELLDFIKDPKNIAKAVEGSMEKRLKAMNDSTELEELLAIANYYISNRQAGHTTAMLEGALNVDNAIVLVHNEMFANDLKRLTKGGATRFVSPHRNYEQLKGQRRPLLVDHHHLANLILKLPKLLDQAYTKGREEAESKYSELIYAVETKHPGQTRHETALMYIRNAERRSNNTEAKSTTDSKEGD